MTTILIIIAVLLYLLVGVIVSVASQADYGALVMVLWLPFVVILAVVNVFLFFRDLIGE